MIQQLRHNLLLQFSVVSLAVMAIIAIVLAGVLARTTRDHIMDEVALNARDTLSRRVAANLTAADLSQGMTGQRYAEFDRFVQGSVVSERTARIKIWNREGMVVYSTDPSQVGERLPIKPELQKALAGGISHGISVPQTAETEQDRLLGTLVEVYVPILLPASVVPVGSLEIYQYYAPLADFISRQHRLIFVVISAAFLLLYLSLGLLVARGWRTITRQQGQLEQREKELGGLNRLLRGHLSQRQYVLEEFRKLYQETPATCPASEEWERYRSRLGKLAEAAISAPPLPPE